MVVAVVAPVESVAFVASVGYEKSNKFCENASLSSSFVLEYGRLSSFSFVFDSTEENFLHKSAFFDFVKNACFMSSAPGSLSTAPDRWLYRT